MESKVRTLSRSVIALAVLATLPAGVLAQAENPVQPQAIEAVSDAAPPDVAQLAAATELEPSSGAVQVAAAVEREPSAAPVPAAPADERVPLQLTQTIELAQAPVAAPVQETQQSAKPPAADRWLLHVEIPELAIYEKPDAQSLVVGQLEQGIEIEADEKSGDWYRIKRLNGEIGWVLNAKTPTNTTAMTVRPFPADRRLAYDVATKDPRIEESLSPEQKEARQLAAQSEQDKLNRERPAGAPIEPRIPLIDPKQVPPPSPMFKSDELPIRDRWRLVKALGLLPYNILDPYNPNVIKGDLPVLEEQLGKEWFFNFGAVSDTVFEARRLPVPVGGQATQNPGSNNTFGNGRATTFVETLILGFDLQKGNTTFKPPELEFKFVPVFNFNRTQTNEVQLVNINPANGITRNDNFVGVQELFVDKHLRDVSLRYDFDSIRVGIQPFNADFRGFMFLDQPVGVRLFGIRDNNQWQYNAAWFRRLAKDTNSGLNDIGKTPRYDDIFLANLYRQDSFGLPGFTSQGIALYNRNREGDHGPTYDANGFLQRPAIFGNGRPYNYDVGYLGYNADGHIGKWNITASAYYATGNVNNGQISNQSENIQAFFAAGELSRDFDWVRVRLSGLYASGDKDPYDNKAQGFDAVLENPQFAGADTSYWIRQAVPLVGGGGVALSMRNGVLPSLRSSREFGQSNFTNPGLHLIGIGADLDVKPGLRVIGNVNYLEFDNLSSLAVLRNQRFTSNQIGIDASIAVQYRPYFSQNVVLNASVGALFPRDGLRQLYGNAVDGTQYSALINLLLQY